MHEHIRAERFRDLIGNPPVLAFAEKTISESYVQAAPEFAEQMRELLTRAFAALRDGSRSEVQLQAVVNSVVTEIFRKQEPEFWFNRIYAEYRQSVKPLRRIQKLVDHIEGDKVLDLGCGDGLTSLALLQNGFDPSMTDVLDYRNEAARSIPFVQMVKPFSIPYADHAFDTAIAFSVLHHVRPGDLDRLLDDLKRVSERAIIEEDCYDIPADLEGYDTVRCDDSHFRDFQSLALEDQLRCLMFIDYFANAITQGLAEMDVPFEFKTIREWQARFEEHGFLMRRVILKGFQKGNFNRSCHVWFILDQIQGS